MIKNLLFINFIYLLFTISSAHAYLDPGTGSVILQAIIGALAAGAVFVKKYWYKLLTLLGIKKKADFDDGKNIDNKK